MADDTQRLLLKQIQVLTTRIASLEDSFSEKLAFINTEHVKELEDLQSVHMIRLNTLTEERDALALRVYTLTDHVDSLEAKLDSISQTARMASSLADSLESLRRDSKCDFDSLASKAEMEREARVSEIRKREKLERELSERVQDLTTDNDNLHNIIEGLRRENERLRRQSPHHYKAPVELHNRAKIQKSSLIPRCESVGELLEADLSLMTVGL